MNPVSSASMAAPLGSATTPPAGQASARKSTLKQEDFMNLFISQMRYQNPLEPMDNFQMATQMAQFSSVEALQQMTQALNGLAAGQASLGQMQAAGLIGRHVEARGNQLALAGGRVAEGYFRLSRPGRARIQIYDPAGNLVREYQSEARDSSRQRIAWDGKDLRGLSLPDGAYTFQVAAADERGPVPVTLSRSATVTGVSFEDGTVYYQLGAEKIAFDDILGIFKDEG